MSTQSPSRSITWNQWFCLALIAFQLAWFSTLLPQWLRGDPPAYPGQYETRLLNSLTMVGILSAAFVSQHPIFKTTLGRALYWLSLGMGIAALITDVITHR